MVAMNGAGEAYVGAAVSAMICGSQGDVQAKPISIRSVASYGDSSISQALKEYVGSVYPLLPVEDGPTATLSKVMQRFDGVMRFEGLVMFDLSMTGEVLGQLLDALATHLLPGGVLAFVSKDSTLPDSLSRLPASKFWDATGSGSIRSRTSTNDGANASRSGCEYAWFVRSAHDSLCRDTISQHVPSGGDSVEDASLLRDVVGLSLRYRGASSGAAARVVSYKPPSELAALLDLELGKDGCSHADLLKQLEHVFQMSVCTTHPQFFNQLFAGTDALALAGEVVTSFLNTSIYTYEAAPALTLMEQSTLAALCSVVGEGFRGGTGIFTPGGSLANIYAMCAARNLAEQTARDSGLIGCSQKLVAFCSAQAHYSLAKGANLIGIGRDNLIKVPCDESGSMDVSQLRMLVKEAVESGMHPFLVCATAGTTVLGAFDNIRAISEFGRQNNLWVHIDGCLGSSLLFSDKHRQLMAGADTVDSISWNPHKLLGIPLQCSMILLPKRHCDTLPATFREGAGYLFKERDLEAMASRFNSETAAAELAEKVFDVGDATVQCGRRVDVLKFWCVWKGRGARFFAQRIDQAMDLAQHTCSLLAERSGRFALLVRPTSMCVCFYYIPSALQPDGGASLCSQDGCIVWDNVPTEARERLGVVTQAIRRRMHEAGVAMIRYQRMANVPQFFSLPLNSPAVSVSDIVQLLDNIELYGEDLRI